MARHDPSDVHDLFALRDALVGDRDAEVRATAILRLHESGARRLLPYLRDATNDPSALVREAAFVGLGRARDTGSLARCADACRCDRSFRVRRAAVSCAVRAGGTHAFAVLALANQDPFWRVRIVAQRASAALGEALDSSRGAPEIPNGELGPFEDPDPAVVTARLLQARDSVEPRALVGVLGHPHHALRRIGVREIGRRGELTVLRRILDWLEDERVPYGPAAAEAALSRSAFADELATELLNDRVVPRAGALAWAITRAPHAVDWSNVQGYLSHADARVRHAAALRSLDRAPDPTALTETLARLLERGDERTKLIAATRLARMRSHAARRVLGQLDSSEQPSGVRALIVRAHLELRAVDALRGSKNDPHGGVRAAALSALSQCDALTAAERAELQEDPDPWVREAVLAPESAPQATRDPALLVRRAAVRLLQGTADQRIWAEGADSEPDPGLRARAATVLEDVPTERATRRLLALARDPDAGVRSAASGALDGHRERARSLLDAGVLEPTERIAAYTLLSQGEPLASVTDPDPQVRAHLDLLNAIATGKIPAVAAAEAPPRAPAPHAHSRTLGKTGLVVHPFALSGAYTLGFDEFARAAERGVNLFFWEPSHRELTRFLRARGRAETFVVAGTYHADVPSIERDVVRALRALERESLDVFLAFWTRSGARLDAVLETLFSLTRRGLIRSAGVSTHDRALACSAATRGADVVMVRHNAAHRGAETNVFPECAARGTAVLTFSNLCYGRMLHRTPVVLSANVTAPDCYRYSLSQPGVHACIAAPRRHSELLEDLAVVDDPWLSYERQLELRAHGDHVYARSKAWSREVADAARAPESDRPEPGSEWLEDPEWTSADP